ncbi:MAG: potassium channel protein [bacterium]
MNIEKRLLFSLFALLMIFVIGTIGYFLLETNWSVLDSLYMTMITISTVGFHEVHMLNPNGRFLTMFLIISGLTVGAYGITNLTSYIVSGQIVQTLRGRRMEKRIQSLRKHIIVAGFGKLGREIAEELSEAEADFVVVEQDEEHCEAAEEKEFMVIRGDASEEETLERAGIKNAYALVAALTGDAGNVMVTITAREMNPGLYIVARGIDDNSLKKLKRAGADRVEMPFKISGKRLTTLVLKPGFVDFIDLFSRTFARDLQMEQSIVPPGNPLVGKTLAGLDLRKKTGGLLVLAVEREDGQIILHPTGDMELRENDRILLMGNEEQIERYRKEYSLTT